MNESKTAANSVRLKGKSNTAKAKPAIELTIVPATTVAPAMKSELKSERGKPLARI